MKNLRQRINKFYKDYSINNIKLTRTDMYNKNTLMNVYEDMWVNMDEDGAPLTSDECDWLTALYGDLGDYIDNMGDNNGQAIRRKLFNLFAMFFGGCGMGVSILCLGLFGVNFSVVVLAVLSVVVAAVVTVQALKGGE